MIDLNSTKEDLILKSLKGNRRKAEEEVFASHEENQQVEDQNHRAQSARRKRRQVNVALKKGNGMSCEQRAQLAENGRVRVARGSSKIRGKKF